MDQSFQSELAIAGGTIQHYSEYLESNRIPGEHQSQALRYYLRQKYADLPPDVVIAHSEASLNFLLKNSKELSQKRRLFSTLLAAQVPTALLSRATSQNCHLQQLQKNLDLALSLQPLPSRFLLSAGHWSLTRYSKRWHEMSSRAMKTGTDQLPH